MTLTLFRIALESGVDAHSLELLCSARGLSVLDVNPAAIVIDPLTMDSQVHPVVVVESEPSAFADLLKRWWTSAGMPELVLDLTGSTITVLRSSRRGSTSVVAVSVDKRWEWDATAESFPDWIDTVLSGTAVGSSVVPAAVKLGVLPAEFGEERDRPLTHRELAATYGLSVTFVETHAARITLIREAWRALISCVPRDDADAVRRAEATPIHYEPSLALVALTKWSGGYSVRLDLGMLEALAECNRSVMGEVASTRLLDGAESAFDEVGIRIAHSFGWLTSVARFPMSTQHSLSSSGEQRARELTTGAVLFLLGHELSHVLLDDGARTTTRASSHARELRADRNAIELLARFVDSGHSTVSAGSLAGSQVTFEMIAAGAGTFLAFEGLRQLVLATKRGELGLPWPAEVVKPTMTGTHPSPFTRLEELCTVVDAVDTSGNASSIIRAVDEGFRALWPEIQRNLPEWVMTLPDVLYWIEANGYDPEKASLFVGETLGGMARDDVLGLLRSMPSDGEVSDWYVNYIECAVGHAPRTVIDTLAMARVGGGDVKGDPDEEHLKAAAARLTPLLTPKLLRYAVCGSLGDVVRDVAEAAADGR